MDLCELSQFFGGSIFHEDLSIDLRFEEVSARIENFQSLREVSDEDLEICKDLLRVVLCVLRGQPEDALDLLVQRGIQSQVLQDPVWRQRFAVYHIYVETVHYFPPLLTFRERIAGPTDIFHSASLKELDERAPWDDVFAFEATWSPGPHSHMLARAPTVSQLEDLLISAYWWVNRFAIGAAQRCGRLISGSLPGIDLMEQVDQDRVSLKKQLEGLVTFRNPEGSEHLLSELSRIRATMKALCWLRAQLRAAGLLKLGNYAFKLHYDLWNAFNDPHAEDILQELRQAYLEDNDAVGAAMCDIIQGDKIIAGPYSSPIILNLALVEGWTVGPSPILEADLETAPLREDSNKASAETEQDGIEGPEQAGGSGEDDDQVSGILHASPVAAVAITNSVESAAIIQGPPAKHQQKEHRSLLLRARSELPGILEQAKASYDAASRLFTDLNLTRGIAAIKFREACCSALLGFRWPGCPHPAAIAFSNQPLGDSIVAAAEMFKASEDLTYEYMSLVVQYLCGYGYGTTWETIGYLTLSGGLSDIYVQQLAICSIRHGSFRQYRFPYYQNHADGYNVARLLSHLLVESGSTTSAYLRIAAALHMLSHSLNVGNALEELLVSLAEWLPQLAQDVRQNLANDGPDEWLAVAWSTLSGLERYLDCTERWVLSFSGLINMDAENRLRCVVAEVVSSFSGVRLYCDWLQTLQIRGKALADTMFLVSQYRQSLAKGSLTSIILARESLSSYAEALLVQDPVLPSVLFYAGHVLQECGMKATLDMSWSSLLVPEVCVPNTYVNEDSFRKALAWNDLVRLEKILETAIMFRSSAFALDVLGIIQGMLPKYSDHVTCDSSVEYWRRMFLVAFAHRDNEPAGLWAFTYAEVALKQLVEVRNIQVANIDDRVAFFSDPDMLRAGSLMARIVSTHAAGPPHANSKDSAINDSMALWYLEQSKSRGLLDRLILDIVGVDRAVLPTKRKELRLMSTLVGARRPLSMNETTELKEITETLLQYRMASAPNANGLASLREQREVRGKEERILHGLATNFEYVPYGVLVIYTELSVDGLWVLTLWHEGIVTARFTEDVTLRTIDHLVAEYAAAIRDMRDATESEWLEERSLKLSELLIKPSEKLIDFFDHIIFVPSGSLAQFPLATLSFKGRYLGLQKAVSQVPSLHFLRYAAKKTLQSYAREEAVTAIVRPGSQREAIFGGEIPLPLTAIEGVCATFGEWGQIRKANTVTQEDLDTVLNSGIVHIATHGYVDTDAPGLSTISLAHPTRVVDLFSSRCQAEVVIFSACSTAAGAVSIGSDVTGFSHIILGAGANMFIGSLWPTDDVASLLHMRFFYSALVRTENNVAVAWSQATQRLYDLSIEDAEAELDKLIFIWDHWVQDGRNPDAALVKNGGVHLQKAKMGLRNIEGEPAVDFSHPYYWAPFILCGYTNIRITLPRIPTPDSTRSLWLA